MVAPALTAAGQAFAHTPSYWKTLDPKAAALLVEFGLIFGLRASNGLKIADYIAVELRRNDVYKSGDLRVRRERLFVGSPVLLGFGRHTCYSLDVYRIAGNRLDRQKVAPEWRKMQALLHFRTGEQGAHHHILTFLPLNGFHLTPAAVGTLRGT